MKRPKQPTSVINYAPMHMRTLNPYKSTASIEYNERLSTMHPKKQFPSCLTQKKTLRQANHEVFVHLKAPKQIQPYGRVKHYPYHLKQTGRIVRSWGETKHFSFAGKYHLIS